MIRRVLAGTALAAVAFGPLAAPASAIRECDAGDVACYETCYLPQIEKGRPIYWNAC